MGITLALPHLRFCTPTPHSNTVFLCSPTVFLMHPMGLMSALLHQHTQLPPHSYKHNQMLTHRLAGVPDGVDAYVTIIKLRTLIQK